MLAGPYLHISRQTRNVRISPCALTVGQHRTTGGLTELPGPCIFNELEKCQRAFVGNDGTSKCGYIPLIIVLQAAFSELQPSPGNYCETLSRSIVFKAISLES